MEVLTIYIIIGFLMVYSALKGSENINFHDNIDAIASIITLSILFLFWPIAIIWKLFS